MGDRTAQREWEEAKAISVVYTLGLCRCVPQGLEGSWQLRQLGKNETNDTAAPAGKDVVVPCQALLLELERKSYFKGVEFKETISYPSFLFHCLTVMWYSYSLSGESEGGI